MARRSSARLRGRRSATPQRVSLSHDEAPFRTPRTAPAPSNLGALEETDEPPGAFPQSASPCEKVRNSHVSQDLKTSPTRRNVKGPKTETTQSVLAKPKDEAQSTKSSLSATELMPHVQFTFRREHSLQLSPEAKKLMEQNREASKRIREQMASDPKQMEGITASGRKMAAPKSKSRFSDAHAAAFNKMASIAGHPSAYRTQAKPTEPEATPPTKRIAVAPPSTLKRMRSQVDLKAAAASTHKTTAMKYAVATEDDSSRGPLPSAKRVKRAAHEDTSSSRGQVAFQSPKPSIPVPSTPSRVPTKRSAATPTPEPTASRTNLFSVQASKLPTPRLLPSQSQVHNSHQIGAESPSRLLSKSPSKIGLVPKPVESRAETGTVAEEALLSRSPLKGSPKKMGESTSQAQSAGASRTPLLSRLAFKRGPAKTSNEEQSTTKPTTSVPLLSRSPTKGLFKQEGEEAKTPQTANSKNLMGRFNLLRASPMKSILRSPQRLYSDDPEKIAAGTHLATPEKSGGSVTSSADGQVGSKRVDFTSSTKERELERQSEDPPSSASRQDEAATGQVKGGGSVEYPTLPAVDASASPSPQKRRQTAGPGNFTFRADEHGIVFGTNKSASPAALKQRPTPTIRHVSSSAAAAAPMASGSKKRKFDFENDTATTENGGEQNKENEKEVEKGAEEISQGPAKRVKTAPKPTPREASPAKPFMRKPTLGVKPKGAKSMPNEAKKRTTTISQSRLNALAQPKRRQ